MAVTVKMASNNSSTFEVNAYLAVYSCSLILFALPGLLLNGLVVVALFRELAKKQGRAQWIILLNIGLAGLVTTLTMGTLSASRLSFVNNVQEGAVWKCRIGFAAFHISIASRTASLAVLSVVMYIIIKHGPSKVKLYPLIAAIIILWMIVVISGIPYLTPAYKFTAFRNEILVCDTTFTPAAYAHISLSLLIIDIPGRTISIFTIIAAAVHVKRSTVTDFSPTKRSLLRFTVVLFIINILIVLTNVLGTLGVVLPMGADVAVLVWLSLAINIAIILPAVVVPVLMMIIFKPIWSAVKGLLTCRRCRAFARGTVSLLVPEDAGLRLCIPNPEHE